MNGPEQHIQAIIFIRNIIFENSNVPFQPISFYEAPDREDLWKQLDQIALMIAII